jgi:hypothetical protein
MNQARGNLYDSKSDDHSSCPGWMGMAPIKSEGEICMPGYPAIELFLNVRSGAGVNADHLRIQIREYIDNTNQREKELLRAIDGWRLNFNMMTFLLISVCIFFTMFALALVYVS